MLHTTTSLAIRTLHFQSVFARNIETSHLTKNVKKEAEANMETQTLAIQYINGIGREAVQGNFHGKCLSPGARLLTFDLF